jgi:acetolactate synthase I/II/III large subunit
MVFRSNTMTSSEYIARYLEQRGVTHVYELIGGMITFLLDSIKNNSNVQIVSMHHEQGAAFAAEGWARMTGIPGVALATSGPGATNLITGIGSCFFDSIPTVFITGQVNRYEQKGDRAIRQLGFQETDIVSMVRPITKGAWLVNNPEDLPTVLDQAFRLAMEGRPGPVLIDIPMDVQRHVLSEDCVGLLERLPTLHSECPESHERSAFLYELTDALQRSERPIVLAGGGVRSADAVVEFRKLIEHLDIPVVHSLMGVDLLAAHDLHRVGLIGSYGNRWSNLALAESDVVLVLGSRLDIRQTGSDLVGFAGNRKFFHVDCEAGEVNNRLVGCRGLIEHLRAFITSANQLLPIGLGAKSQWRCRIAELKANWPDVRELEGYPGINPNILMHKLSAYSPTAAAFITDVGQHQMWAAQSLDLQLNQRFLTSGGMGAMGFAIPAAIGAAFASGMVVVIAGDGGAQLNIQELQTIARNDLPIKLMILNNRCHGMVRQFQEAYFSGRYQSTLWGYDAPSFVNVARAYGIESGLLSESDQIECMILEMLSNQSKPYVLEVMIDTMSNAYPKLAFGRKFGEMEPMVRSTEMEGT